MAEYDVDTIVRDAFFSGVKAGTIVEVGAAGPTYLSISSLYREMGWRVIAVEPNPVFCDAHRALGYEVLEYACADYDRDGVEFLIVDSGGQPYEGGTTTYEGFSSLVTDDGQVRLDPRIPASDIESVFVKVRKLDTLLAEHAPDLGAIDILSVDVEGWELEVLRGLDFSKYRPGVIIVENILDPSRKRVVRGQDEEYADFFESKKMKLWRRIGPNEVYTETW